MSILRRRLNARYKALPNQPAEDASLSFAARGLLWYLLVKPDDWQVVVANLINASPAGRDFVYKLLKELVDAGYIHRQQRNDPDTGQRLPVEYIVSDEPLTALPDTVSPDTVDPTLLNTNTSVSTKNTNTTPPSGGAWSAFHTVTATDLTGDPDGWRRKDGRPYAMHGWLARRIGEAVDGDVGRACELWREYATERGQYLPRNQRTLKTDFGRWLAQWQERESEAALTF